MASIEEAKEIIKGTPISSIVTMYHPISKKGGNFEGICPFHGDSHPSLKINDSKGIYKCFACGAAGDSIKFVQDKLNLDFIGAVKDISSNLGITIEEKQSKNKNPKFEMGLRVLQAANKLYRKVANETSPHFFKEFIKSRNLNADSIKNFELGYAPGQNSLLKYLESIPPKEKDFAMKVALELGLIRNSQRGKGQYDFYRDRVMFPVWDHSGKVRGFSSRAVKPDQVPKYLNSGESFIFDKGNILYGFNLAKNHIREQGSVILVEGNMDVITLHQYGFQNSVATMGVALSQTSCRLLQNMTDTVYLAMDSDPAGIKAMTKINEMFLDIGMMPKFIDFTPAKDPDEYLNQFGRLELLERIEKSKSFIDFLIQQEIPESIPESTDKKLEILKSVFNIILPMKSNLAAQEKAISVAKTLGLRSSSDDIVQEFKNFIDDKKKISKPVSQFKNQMAPEPDYSSLENQYITDSFEPSLQQSDIDLTSQPVPKEEKLTLETLLTHPECILADQITEILDKIDHFEVKRIVQWLKNIYLEIDDKDYHLFVQEKMKEALPDEVKSSMASSLFNYTTDKLEQKIVDKLLGDLLKKLEIGKLLRKKEQLISKQKLANNDADGLAILNEIQQVESNLLAIKNK